MSPDDTAQQNIATAYSLYGGALAQSPPYRFGTMNDIGQWIYIEI
jgi:hypothetical protein